MNTITYEQFCFWLRGYLAGAKRAKIDVISKELERVSAVNAYSWALGGASITGSVNIPCGTVGPASTEFRIGDPVDPFTKTQIICEAPAA